MAAPVATITPQDVFDWGKVKDVTPDRTAEMQGVINAVWAVIIETTLDWGESDEDIDERLAATEQAAVMMSFRVWARKGSPEGAAGFGRDNSLIRVARTDPDVEFFLSPWSLDDIPV